MIANVFQLAGALALFLYGMKVMSDGLQKAAGERLQAVVDLMTVNRFTALTTGFAVTALIQSSSATTVMVVSFVDAGLLSLRQAIGVIMGANIGTTVTGWLVAILGFKFKITAVALPAVGVGLVLLYWRKLGKEDWGEAIVGFGLLFLGLKFLKESVPDIKSHPEYLAFVARFTGRQLFSYFFFVLLGGGLTILVQSSSAAMAITLTMAHAGWIDYPTAAAIVLGENIGTTVTANLASIRTEDNARRSARIHLFFNILGVLWMAVVFRPFLNLVDGVVPGSPTTPDGITSHLAMFHTLFNITNSLALIWFVPQLESLALRVVRQKTSENGRYRFPYIATSIQDIPEMNILKAENEVSRMAATAADMFGTFLHVFQNPKKALGKHVRHLKEMEELTDTMREELTHFLVQCTQENLGEEGAERVYALIRVVNELERVGDNCYNLIVLAGRRHDKGIKIRDQALQEFQPYADLVGEFLRFVADNVTTGASEVALERAIDMEQRVNEYRDRLKKRASRRIARNGHVKSELLFIDILRHMEQIGDHALNIAQAIQRQGVMVTG